MVYLSMLPERIQNQITIDENGCWLWAGSRSVRGYGRIWYQGKRWLAHRLVWELSGNILDPSLVLDHKCRIHACVNPGHLRQVTQKENVQAGLAPQRSGERMSAKTHCPAGHEYSTENTRVRKGSRQCRKCDAERARSRRQRVQNK